MIDTTKLISELDSADLFLRWSELEAQEAKKRLESNNENC